MKKTPFVTLEQAQTIAAQIPTPFHLYDEAGIRKNAREVKEAFAWNPGFKEYFAEMCIRDRKKCSKYARLS